MKLNKKMMKEMKKESDQTLENYIHDNMPQLEEQLAHCGGILHIMMCAKEVLKKRRKNNV